MRHRLFLVRDMLQQLREMRDMLVREHLAPQTLRRIRAAIKSAEGAARHEGLAESRESRAASLIGGSARARAVTPTCPGCGGRHYPRARGSADRLEWCNGRPATDAPAIQPVDYIGMGDDEC